MEWTVRQKKATKVAVIGLGVFGSSLAVALEQGGSEVLGIDSDARKAKRLSHQINCAIADTTSEDALRSMDIATFDSVVVAIDTDFEGSVLTTAALKSLDVRQIICQSSTVHERDILLRVGADQVVEPDYEAARRLAHELTVGERERLSLGQEQSVLKVQIPEHLAGYSLAELDLEPSMDVTVLVIQRKDES
ncbi:MAG TPA: TrkA family potassium uptake protein, partial [Candidatus Sulfomarinibacteraceae bacterium]|nr:TrkA family potassium uptake protein [Candidatus Sulfomarinibacteraceae bacterium]